MRDWNQQFGANNSRCNGGVDIPVNDNPIRLVFNNDRFKSSDDLTGLLGVTARPHFQVDVRSRHPQLLEEDVRHAEVVMLSRMDKSLPYALLSRQGLQNRRRLHEIRPRSNNVKDMHIGPTMHRGALDNSKSTQVGCQSAAALCLLRCMGCMLLEHY